LIVQSLSAEVETSTTWASANAKLVAISSFPVTGMALRPCLGDKRVQKTIRSCRGSPLAMP